MVSILNSHPSCYINTDRKLFFTKFPSVFSPHIAVLEEISNVKFVSDFSSQTGNTKDANMVALKTVILVVKSILFYIFFGSKSVFLGVVFLPSNYLKMV